MGQVSWSHKASTNLRAIHDYIAEDSPFYAQRFVRALIRATAKLEDLPFCGRKVPELPGTEIREVLYSGYRLIYRTEEGSEVRVEILAVVHGRRDLEKVLRESWELG